MSEIERVHRGATLLDERRPGWAEQVDLARLDMASPWQCVLGQVGGGGIGCYNDTCEALGLAEADAQRAHGFETSVGESYGVLHGPWVDEIESRRQA